MDKSKQNDLIRQNYFKDNEFGYKNLNYSLKALDSLKEDLIKLKINIEEKPWYKNILEIHVRNAIEFYNNCKKYDFDYKKENDEWIRNHFKSFMSEVEKFTKFIVKRILKINKNISFNDSINKLDDIINKYKNCFNKQWTQDIKLIQWNLNIWRQKYNENKHDEEKEDNNVFIKKTTAFILDTDVLFYTSTFLSYMIPLLVTLMVILINNI